MTDSTITLKLDPDALDSTTSPSSPSEEIIENEKSPSGSLNLDSKDSEDLSINSKKIRKKRTAYHKIDDEIRIKLLEAVHNGETLKSAAKRYRINYSSAKSVLHTYRKEGRIFKKSGQDTPFESNNTINFIQAPSINLNQSMFYPMQNLTDVSPNSRLLQFQPSPTHGLVDNFMSKLKLESQQNAIEEGLRSHPNQQQQQFPRLSQLLGSQDKTPVSNSFPRGVNASPMSNVNIPPMFQANNPLEKLKYLDGFYMNYSNSPLSNCDRITADTSCGSSRRYLKSNNPKEFESFSDMVNSLQQAHPLQSEEMYASQPPRLNPAAAVQMLQEREEANWSGKIENAAIDTYKTFMDAQNLLKDALKKASYLNNLMHIQKTQSESPLNGQFFNHLSH